MAEENVWFVQRRSRLDLHLVDEVAQRGEPFAVGNLDRNHLDVGPDSPLPEIERCRATAGVMEADQSDALMRRQRAIGRRQPHRTGDFIRQSGCSSCVVVLPVGVLHGINLSAANLGKTWKNSGALDRGRGTLHSHGAAALKGLLRTTQTTPLSRGDRADGGRSADDARLYGAVVCSFG